MLRDGSVAPEATRIFAGPKGYYFVEPLLGAAGRPELNGEALISARPLRDGDRIALGDSVVEYSEPDPLKAQLNERLYQTLQVDGLTGLLAKPRFDDEFESALAAAQLNQVSLGVIMADVDNLKQINDAHGHLLGEFVVGEVDRIIGSFQSGEDGLPASAATSTRPSSPEKTSHPQSRRPRASGPPSKPKPSSAAA